MANNQMPHNLQAESAILGCILIDGDIQSELLETLREDDFYQESNRLVLDAMKKVYAARKPVDIVTPFVPLHIHTGGYFLELPHCIVG